MSSAARLNYLRTDTVSKRYCEEDGNERVKFIKTQLSHVTHSIIQ